MRLTSYGRWEILLALCLCGAGMTGFLLAGRTPWPWLSWFSAFPASLLLLALYFFRDPERSVPQEPGLLVSPADGTVTHIEEIDEPDFIHGRALRISIFLSVFDVHLNRAPCAGRVAFKKFRQGEFVNAMRPDSAHRNEAMDLGLETDSPCAPRVLVRQIAGLIARTIVCPVEEGTMLARGQRYGMIKFGSRTELYVPAACGLRVRVAVGEPVRAGATILGELPS